MDTRLLFISCVFGLIALAEASPTITKCKADDAACIKKSAQALLPVIAKGETGLKALDPLLIKKIDGSTPNLQMFGHDVTVSGLKDCTIESISRDAAKSKLNLDIICSVNVEGDFDIKGKVLVLALEGNAHLVIELKKIKLTVDFDQVEIDKNGKKHWNLKKWDFKYLLLDAATIKLTNVFNDNEQLTQAIHDLLAASSNELIIESGPPIVKAIASEVVDVINEYFHQVPLEDLTLD